MNTQKLLDTIKNNKYSVIADRRKKYVSKDLWISERDWKSCKL